jgi:hypothetical protein
MLFRALSATLRPLNWNPRGAALAPKDNISANFVSRDIFILNKVIFLLFVKYIDGCLTLSIEIDVVISMKFSLETLICTPSIEFLFKQFSDLEGVMFKILGGANLL